VRRLFFVADSGCRLAAMTFLNGEFAYTPDRARDVPRMIRCGSLSR
jgi:hypothetical protein